MQVGSLVTPRWPKGQLMEKLCSIWDFRMLKLIQELPEQGQIYTVNFIGPHCKKCKHEVVVVDEVHIFGPIVPLLMQEYGLPPEFYVEVDPPQENVQETVNQIIEQSSVKEIV